MKRFSIFGGTLLALAGLTLATVPAPVLAQNATASMVIKQTSPKRIWLKAEVLRMDRNHIVVRELADSREIHTFTYSAQLSAQIGKFMDNGGYQFGDKVKIFYMQGQTVALKIDGKPSKPL